MDMSCIPCALIGMISSFSFAIGCWLVPNIWPVEGPYRSQSQRPTLAPVLASEMARFEATVDFPTPPLPEATAMIFLIPGMEDLEFGLSGVPVVSGFFTSMLTRVVPMPSMALRASCDSLKMVSGTFGSLV